MPDHISPQSEQAANSFPFMGDRSVIMKQNRRRPLGLNAGVRVFVFPTTSRRLSQAAHAMVPWPASVRSSTHGFAPYLDKDRANAAGSRRAHKMPQSRHVVNLRLSTMTLGSRIVNCFMPAALNAGRRRWQSWKALGLKYRPGTSLSEWHAGHDVSVFILSANVANESAALDATLHLACWTDRSCWSQVEGELLPPRVERLSP